MTGLYLQRLQTDRKPFEHAQPRSAAFLPIRIVPLQPEPVAHMRWLTASEQARGHTDMPIRTGKRHRPGTHRQRDLYLAAPRGNRMDHQPRWPRRTQHGHRIEQQQATLVRCSDHPIPGSAHQTAWQHVMHRQAIVAPEAAYAPFMRINPDQATRIAGPCDAARIHHQGACKQLRVPMHGAKTVRLAQLLSIPPIAAQHPRAADPIVTIIAACDRAHLVSGRTIDGSEAFLCRQPAFHATAIGCPQHTVPGTQQSRAMHRGRQTERLGHGRELQRAIGIASLDPISTGQPKRAIGAGLQIHRTRAALPPQQPVS
ncbi:hypothetical protein D3C71_1247140 [compost metagenome]